MRSANAVHPARQFAGGGRWRFCFVALALAIIFVMPPVHANDVQVELRAVVAHDDPQSRGLSCVVINNSKRDITVWKGYGGESRQNRLLSRYMHFPIGLYRRPATPLTRVTIAPGTSETVFTLSLTQIFFLNLAQPRREWHWGWAGSPPRGAPPVSPIHGQGGLGWQIRRAESATLTAEVEIDGQRVTSAPLELRFEKPQFEPVKVLVRFDTARVVPPDKDARFYEIRLSVIKVIEGALTAEERTMTLPAETAERLMTEAGARLDKTANRYTFANTVLSLTFARAQTARDGNTQLILPAYAKA